MVQMRAANQATSGDTEWVPMREGQHRFTVGKPQLQESSFKDKDGVPKWNVVFPLQLSDERYKQLQEEQDLQDGQTLSGRTRYRVGLSLGWFPDGKYSATKLVDFLCLLLGRREGRKLRKWFEAGGGGGLDAEEWLGWFEGAEVYGRITHREDKVTPGKFWPDFGPSASVDDITKDDEYAAWCEQRYRSITSGETPSQVAEQLGSFREDEPEPAAVKGGAPARTYEELFGEDGDQD